jgi:hypothetical protein
MLPANTSSYCIFCPLVAPGATMRVILPLLSVVLADTTVKVREPA